MARHYAKCFTIDDLFFPTKFYEMDVIIFPI